MELSIAKLVQKILNKKTLTNAESEFFVKQIVTGNVDQIYMTVFLLSGIFQGFNIEEIIGAVKALRNSAKPINIVENNTIDCCGTGGDKSNTINISTIASFVAVSCGLKVVKHGNRSISSKCGSADLLEQLGIDINMSTKTAENLFNKTGWTFLFAPLYHPGIKHVMPVRNKLKTKTLFNILGPLVNPVKVKYQLIGVYDESLLPIIAKCLISLGTKTSWIVHSKGMDEISISEETTVCEVKNGEIKYFKLSANDFGFNKINLNKIKGDSPQVNKTETIKILKGQGSDEQNQTIAATTAAMLKICNGNRKSLAELSQIALNKIRNGVCYDLLQETIILTKNA